MFLRPNMAQDKICYHYKLADSIIKRKNSAGININKYGSADIFFGTQYMIFVDICLDQKLKYEQEKDKF